jgi:hypothetical protein
MGEEVVGKNEKIGLIPIEKIGSVVPAKAWDAYRKDLAALTAAKDAVAKSKAAVLAAIVTKLKLPDPDSVDFYSNARRVVVFHKPAEKKQRTTALRDLTAA